VAELSGPYAERVRTWSFPEVHPPGPGPWSDEPDKAQWIDERTGFDALAVRSRMGFWCGYVGLPPGHPWHGRDPDPDDGPGLPIGGVSVDFGGYCAEGGEDQQPVVCHVPEPGRPDRVWWLGWHNGHADDLAPTLDVSIRQILSRAAALPDLSTWGVYRPLTAVKAQVLLVAAQCADPWGTGEDWRRSRPSAAG
jgi:hypothetical protein